MSIRALIVSPCIIISTSPKSLERINGKDPQGFLEAVMFCLTQNSGLKFSSPSRLLRVHFLMPGFSAVKANFLFCSQLIIKLGGQLTFE